jgi:hypothetical protein
MIPRSPNVIRHLDKNNDYKLDASEVGAAVVKRFDKNNDGKIDSEELWPALDRMELRGTEILRRMDAALETLTIAKDEPYQLHLISEGQKTNAGDKAMKWTAGIGALLSALALLISGPVAGVVFVCSCLAVVIIPTIARASTGNHVDDTDAARADLKHALEMAAEPGPYQPAVWPSTDL